MQNTSAFAKIEAGKKSLSLLTLIKTTATVIKWDPKCIKVHILETSPSVYIRVLQQSAARIQKVTITVTICAVHRTFNEVSAFPVR